MERFCSLVSLRRGNSLWDHSWTSKKGFVFSLSKRSLNGSEKLGFQPQFSHLQKWAALWVSMKAPVVKTVAWWSCSKGAKGDSCSVSGSTKVPGSRKKPQQMELNVTVRRKWTHENKKSVKEITDDTDSMFGCIHPVNLPLKSEQKNPSKLSSTLHLLLKKKKKTN